MAVENETQKNAIEEEPLPLSLEDFLGVAEKHRNPHAFHGYSKGNFSIFSATFKNFFFYNFPLV